MTFCTKCGAELPEGALVCPKCGTPTLAAVQPIAVSSVQPQRKNEFDVLGAISAGGVLIIMALTWLVNSNLFTLLINYFQSFEVYGRPVMPPYALAQPLVFFLDGIGIWGIVIGGLRLALMHFPRKAVENIMAGVFWLTLSYLLSEFYLGHIQGYLIPAAICTRGAGDIGVILHGHKAVLGPNRQLFFFLYSETRSIKHSCFS
jgi:hypothetical protein